MQTLPHHAQVLIVGAGPSGLAAALSLRKHGCTDIIVVDAAYEGQNSSRAIAIYPATLEVRPKQRSTINRL
jgi:2-polyprenyl-6-methoxyphenol hydroxylase-like FAD-dependent oxidoreductase